ncbi:MAG TPA: CoA ester lyase [Acidimicrobiales bacterium]|jgi:citrate lyase beta subunit
MYKSSRWRRVRCLFETPILDERKWAKIPSIPADAFIIDLEDSVPEAGKVQARQKALDQISHPEYFDGRLPVPRANHLDTPWGREDIVAFAEAGVDLIMYPKVGSVRDVQEVLGLARAHGSDPKILASIESSQGVMEVESIFQMDEVIAATFGSGDLHVDAGIPLHMPDHTLNPALIYPKSKVAMAGVAYGVAVLSIAYQNDLKDLEEVHRTVLEEKAYGFTGLAAFYPPHVDIINAAFTASDEEVAKARQVIDTYERAVAEGNPAVKLANGEVLLVHQYKEAQDVLALYGARAS